MKSSLKNLLLSLGAITAVSAVALALCYNVTEEPRREAAERNTQAAIDRVLPPFDNNPAAEIASVDGYDIYPAVKDNAFAGAAVAVVSHEGFGGDISMIVGFDTEGRVVDYCILQHSETPGLGAKAGEWFESPERNVKGSSDMISLRVDGGDVDAITAATITSRAFVGAVNAARSCFDKYIKSFDK